MSRSRPILALLLLVAALVAAGCGEDDAASSPSGDTSTSERGTGGEAAFPVPIEHKYGKTTITKAPERVAVIGLREQDSLLALGIAPVATSKWFATHPDGIYPWAEDELGDKPRPTLLDGSDGVQVEKVAALRPDLIIAIYSGLTKQEYTTLSKLAPVVAQVKGRVDYGSTWQEELEMVGRAVGRPQEADRIRSETEQLVADAAAEHPEFKGKTAAFATPYQGYYVYGPQDARSRLLESLGFTFPEGLKDIGGGKEFGGELSAERLDLLDTDALIWFAPADAEKKIKRDPAYRDLDVRKQGRDIFLEEEGAFYESTSFITPLSMPTILEGLIPRLEAAVDGDPSTTTDL